MKAQLLITAILVGSVIAQGSYFDGSTSNLNLPFGSSSSSSSSSYSSSGSGSGFGFGSGSSFGSGVQTPTFPTANLSTLSSSSTSSAVTARNIASAIANAQNQITVPTQSVDSLFSRFPSKK